MDLELIELRRRADRVGWGMLIYTALLFVFSFMQAFAAMLAGWIMSMMPDNGESVVGIFRELLTGGISNTLSAAVSIGILTLVFWKVAPMHAVWQSTERRMTPLSFGKVFVVFMGFQFVFSVVSMLFELMLNLFGLSALQALDAVSGSSDSLTMFLYVGIVAPIAEEIVYRGFALRALAPFGKKLAILTSAIMFGLAHANIHQIFYATAVGLVLAYVASEYSIWWSIALHLFNNLVFANGWDRILEMLPNDLSSILSWGMNILLFGLAVVVLVVHWRDVVDGFHRDVEEEVRLRYFFRSNGIIVFLVITVILTIVTLVLTVTPLY